MGIWETIKDTWKASSGNITLKEAGDVAVQLKGCYKIFHKNRLKYVGIAERSIRRRFRELYKGDVPREDQGTKLIYENRDNITVSWAELDSRQECEEVKAKWIRQYRPEWNMLDENK